MSVDHDILLRHWEGAVAEAPPPSSIAAGGRRMDSPSLSKLLRALAGGASRFAAVAPATLNVMGGLSDYAGALVLGTPLGDHVAAVAQRRCDGRLWIALPLSGEEHVSEFHPDELFHTGPAADAARARGLLADRACTLSLTVAATIAEGVRAGALPGLDGGLSVAVAASAPLETAPCMASAASAAALTACSGALESPLRSGDCHLIFQKVAADWLQLAPNSVDPLVSMLGEADCLAQVRTDNGSVSGTLALPDHVQLVGIDCGFVRPDAADRYTNARAASLMGRTLIDRIIRHDAKCNIPWDGFLSRVSVSDYLEKFRHRLPTHIRGKAFLEKFGETGDPFSRIDPHEDYRIRSRTEHHIYEHARSCQFAECLARAARQSDRAVLREAGELMEASHWSYGQRCGLGSVETDLVATLVRKYGADCGIHGVKVIGQGCGGTLAVLMEQGDRSEAALDVALFEYVQQTGRTPRLLRGSMSGCLVTGPRAI